MGMGYFTRAKIIKIISHLQKMEKNILRKSQIFIKKFRMFHFLKQKVIKDATFVRFLKLFS